MIKYMLQVFRNKSPKEDLIQISMEQMYLESGTSVPVLSGQIPNYITPNTWIGGLWEFLRKKICQSTYKIVCAYTNKEKAMHLLWNYYYYYYYYYYY